MIQDGFKKLRMMERNIYGQYSIKSIDQHSIADAFSTHDPYISASNGNLFIYIYIYALKIAMT